MTTKEKKKEMSSNDEPLEFVQVTSPREESSDDSPMKRMDSWSSPSFSLHGSGDEATFPSVVEHSPNSSTTLETVDPDAIKPHLPFPDTVAPSQGKYTSLILSLLDCNLPDFSVAPELAQELCDESTKILQNEPTLHNITVAENETICIIGDIHGQLNDLRTNVFRLDPDPNRKLLFLGDYVDRGPSGVEVICLLLALKVEYPERVFLLRGNHEEAMTSRIYGFLYEVRTKFGGIDLWAKFNSTFCFLPLAAVVNAAGHRILCVHGGLSPSLDSLNVLDTVERADYGGALDTASAEIVDGLLWSDPSDVTARFARNERGCGFAFGAAACTEFCDNNALDFICRAHQIAMEGYYWSHGGRCLTVFSAPNYCGINNNLAAILLVDGKWNLKFIQYDATSEGSPAPNTAKPPSYFS